jgi:hypothetical protein
MSNDEVSGTISIGVLGDTAQNYDFEVGQTLKDIIDASNIVVDKNSSIQVNGTVVDPKGYQLTDGDIVVVSPNIGNG